MHNSLCTMFWHECVTHKCFLTLTHRARGREEECLHSAAQPYYFCKKMTGQIESKWLALFLRQLAIFRCIPPLSFKYEYLRLQTNSRRLQLTYPLLSLYCCHQLTFHIQDQCIFVCNSCIMLLCSKTISQIETCCLKLQMPLKQRAHLNVSIFCWW